ncbi:hypothetical protein RUND412_001188 [Rhizina undulata]
MANIRLSTIFAIFVLSTAALLGWVFYSDSVLWSSGVVKLEPDHIAPAAKEGDWSMQPVTTKKVAVIGAGAGGTSSAYFLRKFVEGSNTRVNITLFERRNYIGGRSTTVNVYDDPSEPVELGASIFVAINQNLVNAADEFGLSYSSVNSARPKEADDSFGVYNGSKFVFTQPATSSKWDEWLSIGRILYKYGPVAPIRSNKLKDATIGKFLKMYTAPIFPFSSISSAAEELGLLEATGNTGEEFLKKNGIEGKFTTELMQASTRVNYGQNLGLIHGLESMVCLAAEGAVSIEGGNWKIFAGMADASGADVRLGTTVRKLRKDLESRTWFVTSVKYGEDPVEEEFDTVILASPWQFSGLEVEPKLARAPDKIPYVTLHVTLFTSKRKLSPEFFGLEPDAVVPEAIFTTLNDTEQADPKERWAKGEGAWAVGSVGFFSISTLRTIIRTEKTEAGEKGQVEYVYKVFSPARFGDAELRVILGAGEDEEAIGWLYRHVWKSYPYLYPRVTFEDPLLDWNLWYTSGIESFISTMETSSLMGMNVAKLVVNDWEKPRQSHKGEDKIKSKL